LRDEIRLLKKFCKANNCYGAETHISGFSGYVCEILVICYGSFAKVLKAAINWKMNQVIDFYNVYKGKNILFEINKSKISSLIVIDPVDKTRNASAALSNEKLESFKKKTKQYLTKPSDKLFEEIKITKKEIKQKQGKDWLVALEVTPLKGKEDVVATKVMKVYEFLRAKLAKNDFKIKESGWQFDEKESLVWFVIKKEKLSLIIIHPGPFTAAKKHVDEFKKKYKKQVFEKDKRLFANIKRPYLEPVKLVKYLLKNDYVEERIKKAQLIS